MKTEPKPMYAISKSLSKSEAIDFARTLDSSHIWYLALVHTNPKARNICKRERYVIVRDVKKGEKIPDGNDLKITNPALLQPIIYPNMETDAINA
jgi:hypothetical protein